MDGTGGESKVLQEVLADLKRDNSAFAEKQKVKRVGFAEDRKKVAFLRLSGVAR